MGVIIVLGDTNSKIRLLEDRCNLGVNIPAKLEVWAAKIVRVVFSSASVSFEIAVLPIYAVADLTIPA